MPDIVLAKLDQARVALYEASTVEDVKRFVDLAATAEVWARQQKLGEEIIGYAHGFKAEALRRLGQLLKQTERATGGDAQRTRFQKSTESPPTLKEMGLDKKTSALAQQVAALSDEEFERVRRGSVAIARAVRGNRRDERIAELAVQTPVLTDTSIPQVPLLYADPPWQYEHPISDSRRIENQYPTMTTSAVCEYPAGKFAAEHAVLFLWVPSPLIEHGLIVLKAWGFSYRTNMAWVKDRPGMGHWCRQRHELLFIGTKGTPPTPAQKPESVLFAPRTKHSEKPAAAYEMIEKMYPEWEDRRVELFARTKRKGWFSIGNEL